MEYLIDCRDKKGVVRAALSVGHPSCRRKVLICVSPASRRGGVVMRNTCTGALVCTGIGCTQPQLLLRISMKNV